jgi:hypothetical protein
MPLIAMQLKRAGHGIYAASSFLSSENSRPARCRLCLDNAKRPKRRAPAVVAEALLPIPPRERLVVSVRAARIFRGKIIIHQPFVQGTS